MPTPPDARAWMRWAGARAILEILLAVGCASAAAVASPTAFAQAPGFSGRYQCPTGTLILRAGEDAVSGQFVTSGGALAVSGTVQAAVLVGRLFLPEGALLFRAQASAESLDVQLFDGRRYRCPREPSPSAVSPPSEAHAPKRDDETKSSDDEAAGPAPSARPARGKRYRSADDGFALRAPKGFSVGEEGGRVFLRRGGETIAAQFHPDLRYAQMEAFCEQATRFAGAGFVRVGAPSRWKAAAGRALALDLSGPAALPVRARAVGIAGPRGALVLLGWAAAGEGDSNPIAGLVDSVAASVRFFKPRAAKIVKALLGTWWTGGGSSSGSAGQNRSYRSHERRVALCPNGRFHDFSQSDVSVFIKDHVGSGGGASASNAYGRWSARGTKTRGTVRLRYDDGRTLNVPYRLQGDAGTFGGVSFGRDRTRNDCGD
jgi:hypothetical protein